MRRIAGYALIVMCVVTFFVNNGVLLPDIMESRNIITAREMVYDGHRIVTTMNGELRLEKPPLPTWFAAIAEIAAPDSITAQRAMAGLAALMLVFFFYRFAERVLRVNAAVAVLLLCTCYNIILMGRTASWDIYCHAFMMGGIYYLSDALTRERRSWYRFAAAGVFIGLSLMSKGPVSLYALFLPFIVCFAAFYRPSPRGKGWCLVLTTVIAIVVGTWWYAYIYLFHAEALAHVVEKETGAWVGHNVRPWFYYWKFFLETGVWSALLLSALLLPVFKSDCRRRQYIFSIAWTLLTLVLLSCLPEKKSRYLLPMLIPASYVMACLIEHWHTLLSGSIGKACGEKWLFRANTWLITAAVIALPVAAYLYLYKSDAVSTVWLVGAAVAAFVIAVWLIGASVRLKPYSMLVAVAVLFVAAEIFVLPHIGVLTVNQERKSIALTRNIEALKPLAFYHNDKDELRIEMVYAAHKNIRPLDLTDRETVMAALPCAVLTHGRVEEEMPADILRDIHATYIDRYDDNRMPKGHRRYRDIFKYNVTILTRNDSYEQDK